ncbi:cytochrome P450 4V2 [Podospora aff. communis PSN243]|uniref:Cytochrome P450 4V2 n=1 Tax=Podospora aff. communis PSN243 TaxID=3040156 RepID=A0AAV9GYV1_9PEZI|nr:cytochrome P450 4V2 [Podospora aff. communis PSN243]
MGLPFRAVSIVAAGTGFALSSNIVNIPGLPKVGFAVGFLAAWTFQFWLWAFWAVVLYPHYFSPLRHLPSPKGGSFFNGQWEKISAQPSGVPMIEWTNSIPNNGIIRYLGLLNLERVMITSPKALAEVLTTKCYDFEKPEQLRWSLGRILGIGILFAEGDEHNIQRRKLMPAFSFRHIKDLYPVFWDKSRESVQAMTSAVLANPVLEVGSWASRATLDMIGVAGLGRDFGAIENPSNTLSQTYQSLFKPSAQGRILGLVSLFIPGWLVDKFPVQRNHDVRHAVRVVRSVCSDLIQTAKQKRSSGEQPSVDILSVALESGSFTDDNLVDQMMTFLLAGHETTASSMTWACYLLAKHPEIQSRLRAEIHANLPPINSSTPVTSFDIDSLPYLHAACQEIFRYFAPVPLLMRTAARNTTIQGVFIPKGTRVIISPWAVNKSVEMWGPDAAEFNPDRWLASGDAEKDKKAASGGASSNYAFMTFLAGPRGCIGKEFAKAEFACLLAAWVGRFKMELGEGMERDEKKLDIKGAITARPENGMFIKMEVVEGW